MSTIQDKVLSAIHTRANDAQYLSLMRVLAGEFSRVKQGAPINDDEALQVIRKMVKNNKETLLRLPLEDERTGVLKQENQILAAFLPPELSLGEVLNLLEPVAPLIHSADKFGPAMGIATKHLKELGYKIPGLLVKQAVEHVR